MVIAKIRYIYIYINKSIFIYITCPSKSVGQPFLDLPLPVTGKRGGTYDDSLASPMSA
jgi:hypothetical protein